MNSRKMDLENMLRKQNANIMYTIEETKMAENELFEPFQLYIKT